MGLCHHKNGHQCRWRRRKDARPEEIVDAALELFVQKGFTATRMDEVAKQAGISKGTLYLYFKNKEAIFHAVVQNIISPLIDEVESQVRQHQGSAEILLRHLMMGWWTGTWNSRLSGIPKLIISEAGNFPDMAKFYVDHVVKRIRPLFEEVIQNGVDKGEFRACDLRAAARLLMAPVIQANLWEHSLKPFDDELDAETYINLHLDLFMHGLTTRGTK